ncbi:hypothetical protein WA026_016018 [Henosepilachna vigintioctopunctata]|uniref:C3H1-type domain-containing protein n=1 Tax=Henosepilachna vigintioctopunctata TaxID=420089 RepID=A0AAW1UCJ6_9CUCU
MSLVADYGSSSESDDESSLSDVKKESDTEVSTKVNDSLQPKLPPPDFTVKSIPDQNGFQSNSVFKNPFLEEENEKEAVLQKHVKMVDLQNAIVINGKKICWNYRKGRCRFGHNCKYAHDSDIQKTPEQIEAEKMVIQSKGVIINKINTDVTNSNDELSSVTSKRKRPGLTQGLLPSKKVMKNYAKHKN